MAHAIFPGLAVGGLPTLSPHVPAPMADSHHISKRGYACIYNRSLAYITGSHFLSQFTKEFVYELKIK